MKYLVHTILAFFIFNQGIATETVTKQSKWMKFNKQNKTSVAELLSNKKLLNLNEDDELKLLSQKVDQLGFSHAKYQQFYCGIPIENAIYILHTKNNNLYKANGNLTVHKNTNTSSTPSLTEPEALNRALAFVNADVYAWESKDFEDAYKFFKKDETVSFYPKGELVWLNTTEIQLAYKFEVYAVEPHSRRLVYIDAVNGEVLKSLEKIHSCVPTETTGDTNYSGEVSFIACKSTNSYILKNSTDGEMQVFNSNSNHSTPLNAIIDIDGHFDSDKAASEVYWATDKAKAYFLNTFNRNSLDGEGMPLLSWVHYTNRFGKGINAYWNGSWMLYGDGDNNNYTSFTSPDIVAHEMTHGITDFSANLSSIGESGALNESFSDIFGIAFKAHCKTENDWIIGSDIVIKPYKNGIRNLSNPNDDKMMQMQPNTYKGIYWKDNGGAHINSGVQNFWFYLLSEGGQGVNDNGEAYNIQGIGIDKAIQIAYNNLNYYLTAQAQYTDARNGAIEAAIDLYGENSFEVEQTKAAWCAVGVGTGCPSAINTLHCSYTDSIALRLVFNGIDSLPWINRWDLTKPMHQWNGVFLNENRCVIKLELDGRNINGVIAKEIGNLSMLEALDLSENNFTGSLPTTIGQLKNLKLLALNNNNFNGEIPISLTGLNELEFLSLGNNQFSGRIPQFNNNQNLKTLDLQSNQLTGLISPVLIRYNLESINLSNNNLTGTIPNFGNNNLRSINLSHNQLSGFIPTTYNENSQLQRIELNDNLLEGDLPGEIGNLKDLELLSLQNNLLEGCYHPNIKIFCNKSGFFINLNGNNIEATWEDFCDDNLNICTNTNFCRTQDSISLMALYNSISGLNWDIEEPITTWQGIQLNLDGCVKGLYLHDGFYIGKIPPEIGNLSKLEVLRLDENFIRGEIPPEIGNLRRLKQLSLDYNELSGKIPGEIENLVNLQNLFLSNNNLTGFIPNGLSSITNLERFDLSNNNLLADISIVKNLTNLTILTLDHNQIFGTIPSAINTFKNLEILKLNNNNLTGFLPDEFLKDIHLSDLDISNNFLQGCFPVSMNKFCAISPLLGTANTNISNGNNFTISFDSFCFEDFPCELAPNCRQKDSLTLLILHESLKGDNGFDFWNLQQNINTWTGVELNEQGCVKSIKINALETNGFLPATIGNFLNLESLWLEECNIAGIIPPEIGNLHNLKELVLTGNNLTDRIPPEIGELFNLKIFELNNNNLTGTIPTSFSALKQLEVLGLKSNNLESTVNFVALGIPPLLSTLTKLQELDVTQNNLYGCFHPSLKSLCNQLGPLAFINEGNSFDEDWFNFCENNAGKCEPHPCRMSDSLSLASIYIKTDGPNWVANKQWDFNKPMKEWSGVSLNYDGCVKKLDLSLSGLKGEFPEELTYMIFLEELNLEYNKLTGSIPETFSYLGNLKTFNLASNSISGSIPNDISNKMQTLKLNNNQFTGGIPYELVNLPIETFTVNNNQLSLCYPTELIFWCHNDNFTDFNISNGNNFSASWSDFCNNFNGQCAPNFDPFFETCRINDSISLRALYNSLQGFNWDTNLPINYWSGITLNENGCVEKIIFPDDNSIFGIIPPEIGNFNNLEVLKISNNMNIIGEIPPEIGNLFSLKELTISNTGISGYIPADVGYILELGKLILNDNNLTGSIPATFEYLHFVYLLQLNQNQLSGCYPPNLSSLCHFNNSAISDGNNFDAEWEDFCTSNLGACLPEPTCRVTDSLALLAVYNSIDGYEPNMATSIENWPGVMEINETGCVSKLVINEDLGGVLPPEIGNFSQLTELVINDSAISGSLPEEIGNLHNLVKLIIWDTNINADFPSSISNLEKLEDLRYVSNPTDQTFPLAILNIESLKYLHLNSNGFTGAIPEQINNLVNLEELHLNLNEFTGEMPSSLVSIPNLSILTLNYNFLSGCFDDSLLPLCDKLGPYSSNYYISDNNLFDTSWEDFCLLGSQTCVVEEVWPGDFDHNGIVDKDDLLYYGLAEGNTGIPRENASTVWFGQQAPNWQNNVNGVNGKHQDADGNGIVNQFDIQPIIDNYGKTTDYQLNSFIESPVQLILDSAKMALGIDEIIFTYEIYARSSLGSFANVHGISASIDFSDLPVKDVNVDFTNSSLAGDKYISNFDDENGILDIGITRTDKANKVINGSLARVVVIIEDIPTGNPYYVKLTGGSIMSSNGILSAVSGSNILGVIPEGNGLIEDLAISIVTTNEQCNSLGSATVQVLNGTPPFKYSWSNGASTKQINNLFSDNYSVTVTDANDLYATMTFQINGTLQMYDENGLQNCESTCPNYLTTYPIIHSGEYKAAKTLSTNGEIKNNKEVKFKAGESIVLEQGFQLEKGAELLIDIENCELP